MNIDPNAYLSKPPAIIRAAKDWRFYENAIIHHETAAADLYLEYKGGGAWREHYKTWRDACEPLGLSRRRIDKLIQEEVEIRPKRPTEDKADTLAKVNYLTNPLAELEAKLDAVKAIKIASPPPVDEPKSVTEFTRATKTDAGKPIYALPVWKDLYNDYGHALNKIHDAHRVVPNAGRRDHMLKATKELMDEAEIWNEEAR